MGDALKSLKRGYFGIFMPSSGQRLLNAAFNVIFITPLDDKNFCMRCGLK